MKILVVEDERIIAHAIKEGLEQDNYAVDVAYDGEDGYNTASADEYDVIISDVMMPEMTGTELAVEVKPAWRLAGLGRFKDGILSSVSNMPTCEEWLKGALDPTYPWDLATRLEATVDLPPEVRGTDVTIVPTAIHPSILGPIADHVGVNNYHCKEPSYSIAEWRSGGAWQPIPREYTGSTYEVNGPVQLRIRLHGNASTTVGLTTLIARWTE